MDSEQREADHRARPRIEDERFLTGRGQYLDDIDMPGLYHAAVARLQVAHASIQGVDISQAEHAPGVVLVLTAETLRAQGVPPIPIEVPPPGPAGRDPSWSPPTQPVLASDRGRFVGEAVAFVVAETAMQAKDAAELIEIEYEDLAAVAGLEAAIGHAVTVSEDFPDNVLFSQDLGDRTAVEAQFSCAAHIARLDMTNNRVFGAALEPRGCIGEHDDATGRYTLRLGSPRPHNLQRALADHVFHIPRPQMRVVALDTGGGFGPKNGLYPEFILCLVAARLLSRPVKWVAERGEALSTDNHCRDNLFRAELALDDDNRILAIRVERNLNIGAYTAPRTMVPAQDQIAVHLTGVYEVPAAQVTVRGILSNMPCTSVYRGAGRPEVVTCCERLMDLAAREVGMDPIAFRRHNLISLESMPVTTALGATYQGLDFEGILDRALERAQQSTFANRRTVTEASGLYRGLGVSLFVESHHGSPEPAPAAVFLDGETICISVGTMSTGHGHETAFLQIAASRMGLPIERFRLVQGDTEIIPDGIGTAASWSLTLGGSSVHLAALEAIERGRQVAAEAMEATIADIEFENGEFRITGANRAASWDEVFRWSPNFRVDAVFDDHGETDPVGCHVCEVEVDPETGVIRLDRYTIVQDTGRLINPMIVEGQLHGGATQGIGQAWCENVVYDPEYGQLMTGSFMDYAVLLAQDLPFFQTELVETEGATNPLGVKGIGEAGAVGSSAAFLNAVIDALAPLSIRHIDMPLTPEHVWRAIREATAG